MVIEQRSGLLDKMQSLKEENDDFADVILLPRSSSLDCA